MASKNIVLFQGMEQQGPVIPLLSNGHGFSGGTIVARQYNRYGHQWKTVMDSTPDSFGMTVAADSSVVGRAYFSVSDLPASGQTIPICGWHDSGGVSTPSRQFYARLLPSGYVEAGFHATSANPGNTTFTVSSVSPYKVCPQRWHRIDMKVDSSGNPWLGDWMLDDVPSPQVSLAAASVTWTDFFCGCYFTISGQTARDLYIDDAAAGTTLADYPYGPGRSVLLVPDGFESTSGTGAFRDESGGAFDSAWWQRVSDGAPPAQDNVALASANDGLSLEMFGPFSTGNHLTFSFEDLALDAGSYVSCVKSWHEIYGSTGSHFNGGSYLGWIVDTATLLGETYASETSNLNVQLEGWSNGSSSEIPTRVPVPAGGWTEALVNSARLKWRTVFNDATAPSSTYEGLAWLAMEVHLSDDIELTSIGCSEEVWGSIAA